MESLQDSSSCEENDGVHYTQFPRKLNTKKQTDPIFLFFFHTCDSRVYKYSIHRICQFISVLWTLTLSFSRTLDLSSNTWNRIESNRSFYEMLRRLRFWSVFLLICSEMEGGDGTMRLGALNLNADRVRFDSTPDVSVSSPVTKQKAAAAKQFIENHYKNYLQGLQDRKERYDFIVFQVFYWIWFRIVLLFTS